MKKMSPGGARWWLVCFDLLEAKGTVTLRGGGEEGRGSSAGRGEVTPEVTRALKDAQCVARLCVDR